MTEVLELTPAEVIAATFARGRGGGKGGSAGGQDPNSLASNARARLVEVIGEGPIWGLMDGDASIHFSQTPVRNSDNSYNYPNVIWEEHKGYPDDGHFNGQNGVETPHEVNVEVKIPSPVVRTVIDPDADAVRIIVRIPALFQADSSNGSIRRTDLSYAIDVRANAGAWTEVLRNEIEDEKATSPVQISHYIKLPFQGAPWDIRVRRITPDSTDDNLQNALWWDTFIVLVEGKFTYPNTAAIALEVNSEDMGSSVPDRAYHVRGLLIKVPSNYDPFTREYTGIWDGTFKIEWSNNPAWVFYDLITSDRYGLGEFVDASIIDKWSLYAIAQYCDQLVPSGYKNGDTGEDIYEPRFSFNGVLNSRDEAYFVLQQITQAWRGMVYWSAGQVIPTADMPADPVKIVTPANVIGGDFSYSSTAMKARHSVAVISWNDPNDFYRPAKEVVVNQAMLNRFGWREKSLQLTGCTSRGLAHRYGKWALDVEQNETETVEYSASWDHADVRPGHIIAVADPKKAQIRLGGRIVSCLDTTVELDFDFEPTEDETYELMLTMPDGTIERRAVLAFLDERTVRLATPFSQDALPNAVFTIVGSDVVPRQYRVISIQEKEENIFSVVALFHDPQKYDRIEHGVAFEPLPYTKPRTAVAKPTNVSVREEGYVANGVTYFNLIAAWTPPLNEIVRGYIVNVDTPTDGRILLGTLSGTSTDLKNTTSGLYIFYVQTVNYLGQVSEAAVFEYEATGPFGFAPPIVTDLHLKNSPSSNQFTGRDIRAVWKNNFANSIDPTSDDGSRQHVVSPHYSHNIVRIYRTDTDELLREVRVVGEEYTYDFASNLGDNIAAGYLSATRSVRFEVQVYDIYGRTTPPATAVFSNPVPAPIAPTYIVTGSTIFLSYPSATDLDFAGVILWRSTEAGIDTTTDLPFYDGTGNPIVIPGDHETTYYFRIAAYDDFGKTDLNISSEFSITTLADGSDTEAPDVPTNFELTSVLTTDGRATLIGTWDANGESDLAGYDLELRQAGGNFVAIPLVGNRYELDVFAGTTYEGRVRARDKSGNISAYTSIVTHEVIQDVTPPAAATDLSLSVGLTSLWMKWTNAADADLSHVEVLEATTNDDEDAVVIAEVRGNSFSRTGLPSNVERFYWLRSVDFSGNKSALAGPVSGTTALLPDAKRISFEGLLLVPNSPAANSVSWAAFTITYGIPGGAPVVAAVDAGNAEWSAGSLYLYYVEGETTLRTTASAATIYTDSGHLVGVYRGGTDVQLANGQVMQDGGNLLAHTVGASQLVVNDAIITNTLQLADAVITSAKVESLDAEKLQAGTALAGSITVSGTTLDTINDRAEDPAAQVNTKTTLIDPGKIEISGGTTLASWRNGTDATKIEGGSIAANTIAANVLNIGLRGVTIENITFEHNSPVANSVSWTAGSIRYIDDDGSAASVDIEAGNTPWTTGTVYLFWTKGATTISVTTVFATANSASNVLLATYRGGIWLVANYGRTIIDGASIKTQSIDTDQLKVGAVTADIISVTSLSAISANLGAVTAGSININDRFTVSSTGDVTIKSGPTGARLQISNQLVEVYDASNTLRVRMGIW